jgi:hypothetical protein
VIVNIVEAIKAFFAKLLSRVDVWLFKSFLKRFSEGDQANFLYHKTELGEFFFFREDGWPGEIEWRGFNPTPVGNTFLTLVIRGQPPQKRDDPLVRAIDAQVPNVPVPEDTAKDIVLPDKIDAEPVNAGHGLNADFETIQVTPDVVVSRKVPEQPIAEVPAAASIYSDVPIFEPLDADKQSSASPTAAADIGSKIDPRLPFNVAVIIAKAAKPKPVTLIELAEEVHIEVNLDQ